MSTVSEVWQLCLGVAFPRQHKLDCVVETGSFSSLHNSVKKTPIPTPLVHNMLRNLIEASNSSIRESSALQSTLNATSSVFYFDCQHCCVPIVFVSA